MSARIKFSLVAALCVGIGALPTNASAITVEVAKKCDALLAKAFPPRVIGNPAAGSVKGSWQDEQTYFHKCVANGGKVDDQNQDDQDHQSQGDQDHKDTK
jgi:hypothetical protein